MGCGGSKQGVVAATGTCVSYRRLLRTRSGAANSHFKFRTAQAAPASASAAVAAVLSDVEEITAEVDGVRMAAGVEEEAGRNQPPDQEPPSENSTARSSDEGGGVVGACTGDAPPAANSASNERGGGCTGERRAHGMVRQAAEGEEKMACSTRAAAAKICDASKSAAGDHGPAEQGEKTSPDRCHVQVEDLRVQLQQVAEQLADFQVWSTPEDDDDDSTVNGDTEKVVITAEEEETHDQEEGLNSPLEEEPEFVREPVFKDDNDDDDEFEFGDIAAEVFKVDFSSKIPVYDEYPPHDLPQVPSGGCDFSAAEGSTAIASYNLSFGRENGVDDDQIQQVLYQKFVKVRRSKPYGSGGRKRRTQYQLHQKQIRKRRKRRSAYEAVRQ